jgi:uncharacterized RDD family membrane protein YckC
MMTSGNISLEPPFTFYLSEKPRIGQVLPPFGIVVAVCAVMSWAIFLLALPLVAFLGAANRPKMKPKNARLSLVLPALLRPFIPQSTTFIFFLVGDSSRSGERLF